MSSAFEFPVSSMGLWLWLPVTKLFRNWKGHQIHNEAMMGSSSFFKTKSKQWRLITFAYSAKLFDYSGQLQRPSQTIWIKESHFRSRSRRLNLFKYNRTKKKKSIWLESDVIYLAINSSILLRCCQKRLRVQSSFEIHHFFLIRHRVRLLMDFFFHARDPLRKYRSPPLVFTD